MKILLFIVTYKASYRVVKVIDEIPKKYFAKLYNKVYRLLQGSGLSKFQSIRRIHIFFTKKVKSEFVDFYGLKLYLTENDSENYSGGINYEDDYFDYFSSFK
jgi:hypothetical protein